MSAINSIKQNAWSERYRPHNLETLMVPSDVRQVFSGDIQNFLFIGPQGTGKTSAAKVLTANVDAIKLNMSLDKGIDTIRHTITRFATGASLEGTYKVIILDEMDALSKTVQQSLRGVIEDFHATTKFIATCNYPEKIIAPLRSRFKEIDFSFSSKEHTTEQMQQYAKKIVAIMQQNGMSVAGNNNDVIIQLINNHFPDFRSIVNQLEYLHKLGKDVITVNDVATSIAAEYTDLYELLFSTTDQRQLYSFVSKYKMQEAGAFASLNSNFVKWMLENKQTSWQHLGDISVCVHKYCVESKESIDMLTTLFALVYSLSKIVKQ